MGTYRGEVTVLLDDVEYTARADLHDQVDRERIRAMATPTVLPGLISWGGSLDLDDEEAARNISQGGISRLRLRDGREGDFTASRGKHDLGTGHLVISGCGPAPF
ncbi:hypothetical protein [Streptomyces sp. NPDC058644]|uniref:hypothetical protein n=1 Tax=unclassified Streptomyces TaxID=2593676 RepID=UPI00365C67F1